MNAEDRKRVEGMRRYVREGCPPASVPKFALNYIDELLAILDRVDPAPPPERIVVSHDAIRAFWAAKRIAMIGVNDEDGLRAAFKVMLADTCIASGYAYYAGWAKEVYRALTGEEIPS